VAIVPTVRNAWNCEAINPDQPSAFGDRNYSHPNLELGLLVINYAASHQEAALQLLGDFLDKRSQLESNDRVLFRLTSPTPAERSQHPTH
jgi:hypothetical protein